MKKIFVLLLSLSTRESLGAGESSSSAVLLLRNGRGVYTRAFRSNLAIERMKGTTGLHGLRKTCHADRRKNQGLLTSRFRARTFLSNNTICMVSPHAKLRVGPGANFISARKDLLLSQ